MFLNLVSDYSITFSFIKLSEWYIRFPFYILLNSIRKINKNIFMEHRGKFCAIFISNGDYHLKNIFLMNERNI